MNEQNIKELLNLISIMADEIKSLKNWRAEQTQRQTAEETAKEQNRLDFEQWLNDRKAREEEEEKQAAELRRLMV